MPGGNHIPVNRDDADNIPPVVGVESRSMGRAPGRASTALPGNLNHATINIGGVLTERSNPVRDDFAHQPRLVLIGRPFAAPFLIIPFNHEGEIANAH